MISGLEPLRAAGFAVEKKTGLSSADLSLEACATAMASVVRSETKVTAAMLDGPFPVLRVVGRAGVGVDNIDVAAATARGIVVMNAPDGNTITTAEHTIALLIALCAGVCHRRIESASGDRGNEKSLSESNCKGRPSE